MPKAEGTPSVFAFTGVLRAKTGSTAAGARGKQRPGKGRCLPAPASLTPGKRAAPARKKCRSKETPERKAQVQKAREKQVQEGRKVQAERGRCVKAKVLSTFQHRNAKISLLLDEVQSNARHSLLQIALAFGTTVESIYADLENEEALLEEKR